MSFFLQINPNSYLDNVQPSHQLPLDVELGVRGPVGKGFQPLAHLEKQMAIWGISGISALEKTAGKWGWFPHLLILQDVKSLVIHPGERGKKWVIHIVRTGVVEKCSKKSKTSQSLSRNASKFSKTPQNSSKKPSKFSKRISKTSSFFKKL